MLNKIDKQSIDDIKRVIEWCQKDSFWHQNILSGFKLRLKFSQLMVKMNSNKNKSGYGDRFHKRQESEINLEGASIEDI